jgi:hypothetical protein
MENLPIGLMIIDKDGRILRINRKQMAAYITHDVC